MTNEIISALFQAIMTGLVGLVIAWVIKRPMDKYLAKRDQKDIAFSKYIATYYSSILNKVDTLGEIVIIQACATSCDNAEIMKLVSEYKQLDKEFREDTAKKMASFSQFDYN
jgi:amino acid permease